MFVYSAFDRPDAFPHYLAQAVVSARSVRRHSQAPIALFTNSTEAAARLSGRPWWPFTTVRSIPDTLLPKAAKIAAIGTSDGADVIFLDCDTFVLGDLMRVFETAPFDIAGVTESSRDKIPDMDAAVAHEADQRYALNSGVLFVRGAFAARFSAAWMNMFDRTVATEGPAVFDQLSLRSTLRSMDARVFNLPNNYNFRLRFGGLLGGACFVVHVHYDHPLRRIVARNYDVMLIDRLIDHVSAINQNVAFQTLAAAQTRNLNAIDFRRTGWQGPGLARRVWRAARGV